MTVRAVIADEHAHALTALVGERGFVSDAGDMAAYETGARYDAGRALAVVRPRTTEEVSAVLSYCVRHGLPVVPQSGNTGLVSGSTPDGAGGQVVLSLDRMTGHFVLDPDNRSLDVDAGLLLSEVNRRLETAGLFFPIDLGADPRLGGMIATNTGGSRFLKYGDVRRNVLGLTVVLADAEGTILEFGQALRKNNTGVDWKQLFIGTSGVFGVVTRCVLNLERLPLQTATAYLVPAGPEAVMPLLRMMEERLGTTLSAFEGMSRNAISAALDHVPSLRNPFQNGEIPDYVILAEVSRTWPMRESEEPLGEMLESVLAEIFETDAAPLADAFIGPAQEMWSLRHALSEGVKQSGRLIAFDVAFRRGDIMTFCERMKHDMPARFPQARICDFGHIGDGGVHLNIVFPRDAEGLSDGSLETALRDWVYSVTVEDFAGSFSAEHAIGRKNQHYYDLYTPQKIKDMACGLLPLTSPGGLGTVRFG
ncbi:FAD-dependent oxidoreductase [Rhizobium sp. Leaf384]|uniref:FAD-binding oxidoreductase n=1 Tax=unclassified Rhizobium TaxID=2613769 RepID=UPI00071587EB|nr:MULTISPECIES: FAD-binding oxidoreductase [unclassified Rhizobium]KQS76137.1 FAD-dependent oxidoreductase [Rhizobium sp. Leaf384]KQS85882.1 FAD-dependent oxidoreductase [Rhizobium sp. Leaf383]